MMYRMSAIDLVEGGAPAEEIDALARAVEAAGADILNTGIGWHEARVPTIAYSVPRGGVPLRRGAAASARSAIPVVASNRINTPEVAEEILAERRLRPGLDGAANARRSGFRAEGAEGRAGEINTCIACNQACLDSSFPTAAASCLVNPRAGRETEFDERRRQHEAIAVVGAGAGRPCAARSPRPSAATRSRCSRPKRHRRPAQLARAPCRASGVRRDAALFRRRRIVERRR